MKPKVLTITLEDIKKLEKEQLEGELSYLSELEGIEGYDEGDTNE